jgi:hypothetical protein
MALAVALPAAAQRLPDVPPQQSLRGNAFVDAWLVLRGEIDALSATSAHPALLEAWIASLPRPILVDMLRIATEPRTKMAIASRLAQLGTPADREELQRLQKQISWQGLSDKLTEIRVRAGDRALIARLRFELDSEAPVVRLAAAERLACAGDGAGLAVLRKALDSDFESQVSTGARALGRCGAGDDLDRLRQLARRRPKDPAALSALGEFLLRKHFPWHYYEIDRRDAAFVHESTPGGSFDTWYSALGQLIEQGILKSASVPAALVALYKKGPLFEDRPEVLVRRLTSLSEAWSIIEASLAATKEAPAWPKSFSTAVAQLSPVPPQVETPADRARRITAAVSLLQSLCDALDYAESPKDLSVAALSPGLERALDRSFSTTARLMPGQVAVLSLDKPTAIRELRLSTVCSALEGGRLAAVRIELLGAGNTSAKSFELDPNDNYFQTIKLNSKPATKLKMSVEKIAGKGPACLAELRVR